jgi:site-specific DNA-methyltransferase (adenine-specific)
MFVFSKGKPNTFNPLQEPCKTAGREIDRNKDCSAVLDRGNFKGVWKRDAVTVTKSMKRKSNVWVMATGARNYGHPAVFPEQLAKDHILSWSNPGDVVFDPFMGSGTTAKMAALNGRNYIGMEISKKYCEIAQRRLSEINAVSEQMAMQEIVG